MISTDFPVTSLVRFWTRAPTVTLLIWSLGMKTRYQLTFGPFSKAFDSCKRSYPLHITTSGSPLTESQSEANPVCSSLPGFLVLRLLLRRFTYPPLAEVLQNRPSYDVARADWSAAPDVTVGPEDGCDVTKPTS